MGVVFVSVVAPEIRSGIIEAPWDQGSLLSVSYLCLWVIYFVSSRLKMAAADGDNRGPLNPRIYP